MNTQQIKTEFQNDEFDDVFCADLPLDDVEELRQKQHLSISSSIVMWSAMATVLVGREKKTFVVHSELLTLHSGYFRKLVGIPKSPREEDKTELVQISQFQFANFVKWLYSGVVSNGLSPAVQDVAKRNSMTTDYEALWAVGQYLECQDFQNYCMMKILDRGQKRNCYDWPTREIAAYAYKHSKKGSALRKLVSDCLGVHNPMKGCKEGGKSWAEWQTVLTKYPELSVDMHNVDAKMPELWTADWKFSLMVENIGLDERWEQQILARMKLPDIRLAARGGCFRSFIEEKHIESRIKEQQKKAEEYEMV